jgi:hypothetical protein
MMQSFWKSSPVDMSDVMRENPQLAKQVGQAAFASASKKDRVKYVDITPMWGPKGIETFPKVFPYYVLDDVSLTSYGGFTFYLSARADYMKHAPVQGAAVAVQPDWDLLEASGADFVVARDEDLKSAALRERLGISDGSGSLALPDGARIHPIRFAHRIFQATDLMREAEATVPGGRSLRFPSLHPPDQ